MRVSQTTKPRIRGQFMQTADKPTRDVLAQLEAMHGKAVVVQDETGGDVGLRLNRSTGGLEYTKDRKTWLTAVGGTGATTTQVVSTVAGGGGGGSGSVTSHHDLYELTTYDDHTQYLKVANLPSVSVDSEVVLFSGITGKVLKRASASGLALLTSGVLSTITDSHTNWDAGYTYRLTSASGSAPLTLTLAANGLTGSMTQAATAANGWLSSTDWNTFNSKQAALTTGNLTATLPLSCDNTRQVIGGAVVMTVAAVASGSSGVAPASGTPAARNFLRAAATTGAIAWDTLTSADVGLGNVTNNAQVTSVTGTSPIASSGGVTPAISIANAAADGATLGAAAFNATNFSAAAGVVNTIQGISTAATPQFARLGLGAAADATAPLNVVLTGLATTSTAGSLLKNTTAATSGVPVQRSPGFNLSGTGYDTGTTTSKTGVIRYELRPVSANPTTATAFWRIDPGTGTLTDRMSLSSAGILSVLGTSSSNAGVITGATSFIRLMGQLGATSFNPLVQAADSGIIFHAGSVETGALVIAPWSASSYGLRMSNTGALTLGGTFTATTLNATTLTASKPVFTDASKNLVSTGTLGVDQGGTNKTAWTQYAIPYASTTAVLSEVAIGTAGQVLAVNVGANGYTWAAIPPAGGAAGSDTHVQFNDGGTAFGGTADFKFNKTPKTVELGGKIATYNGVATEGYGVPAIVDNVALTGQIAEIGATNFTNAGTAGFYKINWYLVAIITNTAPANLLLTISWTDDAGATSVASGNLTWASAGRLRGSFPAQLASGSISYTVTFSTGARDTGTYAVYMTAERLV